MRPVNIMQRNINIIEGGIWSYHCASEWLAVLREVFVQFTGTVQYHQLSTHSLWGVFVTDDIPNTNSFKLNIRPVIVEIFTPGLFLVSIPSSLVGEYRCEGHANSFLRVKTVWCKSDIACFSETSLLRHYPVSEPNSEIWRCLFFKIWRSVQRFFCRT